MVLPNLSNLCITEVHVPTTPRNIQEELSKMTSKPPTKDTQSSIWSVQYDDGTIVKYEAVEGVGGTVKYVIKYILWADGEQYFYENGVLQRIEKTVKGTHITYFFKVINYKVRLMEEIYQENGVTVRVKKWRYPEDENKRPQVYSDWHPGQREYTKDKRIWLEGNDPNKKKQMHQEIPPPEVKPDRPDRPDKPDKAPKDGTKKSRQPYREQKNRKQWKNMMTPENYMDQDERKKQQRVQAGLTGAFDD
jgi:hypothetical protein